MYEPNGDIVGTYTAPEVMGHPLNALAWLTNHSTRFCDTWAPIRVPDPHQTHRSA